MASPAPLESRSLSVEEYLALEERSAVRYEYVSGEVYALAGATDRHNRIAGNIFAHLWGAARRGPCRVYQSDMRLRVADDLFYYPDVLVVCDPTDTGEQFKVNPCVVVEVLSPSTEAIDRREKMLAYRRLASLQAYVIVERDRRVVERYWRDEHEEWQHTAVADKGLVPFPCVELELTLDEIYEGVAG